MKTVNNIEVTKELRSRRKRIFPTSDDIGNNDLEQTDENLPLEQTPPLIHYGVLGTGSMGSQIAISLINMGKKVYIWNRTVKKCEKLLENLDQGVRSHVEICHIPGLLMQRSDIIFNCISDSHSSKAIIVRCLHENFVPDNFMQGKGLVDMSGIDLLDQKELNELVVKMGGKYLEVRIQIKNRLIGGGYLFLISGNEDLFTACKTCLLSLGGNFFYLRDETGYVTKLNLILQLIKSACLLGLTEAFTLLERIIPVEAQQDLLPFLLQTPLCSDYVKSKSCKIVEKNFDQVEQSLKNLGNDIRLGMQISRMNPMLLSSIMEQIFKHSQKLGYGEKDPSAVFMRIRH